MRKITAFVATAVIFLSPLQAQTSAPPASTRKVLTHVAPAYPDLARKMHVHGTVKIEAIVRSNGLVRATRVLGGNPVLIEAASDAVKRWKFEPAPAETTEVVQLSFEGQ